MAIDIDQSHYNTGTATVAANGVAVTGQGTTWLGAVRKGDMFGTHKGEGIRILSVNSNTSLTLAYPWLGGAQTAAVYEIQRTPFDVGYLKAIEDLLTLMGGPALTSLAGIDYAGGDKGLMINAAGSVLPYALTAAARSLLNNPTTAAMLSFLGALPASGGTTTGLVNVGLPGSGETVRLYVNGLKSGIFFGTEGTTVFGWMYDRAAGLVSLRYGASVAAAVAAPKVMEMNAAGSVTFNGIGAFNTGLGTAGYLNVNGLLTATASANIIGTLGVTGPGNFSGDVTAAAGLLFGRGNVLGPTSQSGGVPTGRLIEMGGNPSAGYYARFAGGFQRCVRNITFSGVTWSLLTGSVYYTSAAPAAAYPAAFVDIPSISIQSFSGKATWLGSNGVPTAAAWPGEYPLADIPGGPVDLMLSYIAEGRWHA